MTGGRFSEVIDVIKTPNGTKKWRSLWTGGRYSEVVVSSGLTVFTMSSVFDAMHSTFEGQKVTNSIEQPTMCFTNLGKLTLLLMV